MITTHIVITGHEAGKTWMYEQVGKQGSKRLVPTYRANLERADRTLFWFAVTRDSAEVVFGRTSKRFQSLGECPPSRAGHPYYAKDYQAKRNGRCLLLHEGQDDGCYLYGAGSFRRTSILIHPSPASSLGCFGVACGQQGFKNFWQEVVFATKNFAARHEIRVHVEPRPQSHHERLLAR